MKNNRLGTIAILTTPSFFTIACSTEVKQKFTEISTPVNAGGSTQTIVAGVVTLVNGVGEITDHPNDVCQPSMNCVWQITNCGFNKSTELGLPIVYSGNIGILDPKYPGMVAYITSTNAGDQSTFCWTIVKS